MRGMKSFPRVYISVLSFVRSIVRSWSHRALAPFLSLAPGQMEHASEELRAFLPVRGVWGLDVDETVSSLSAHVHERITACCDRNAVPPGLRSMVVRYAMYVNMAAESQIVRAEVTAATVDFLRRARTLTRLSSTVSCAQQSAMMSLSR
jgi:hypothetical protein